MTRERRGVSMETPYQKQYIKDVLQIIEKRSIKTKQQKCKTIICIANTFTHKSFYVQKLLHIKAFIHRNFYKRTFLHTDPFTHRRFYKHLYIKTLLHTNRLHTKIFTHRSFYTYIAAVTQKYLLHSDLSVLTPLYTETL